MSIGPWDFTSFDIVVLLVIVISLIMAANRGLFRELISITALSIAAIAALFIYGRFRFSVRDMITPNWLADGALGLGSFMLTYLLCVMLFSGIVKNLRGKDVGVIDRTFGAGFGVLRGLIVCSLATMLYAAGYSEKKELFDAANQPGVVLPEAIKDLIPSSEPELPKLLQGSVFYPTLDKIGAVIRSLPFSRMETMADKLKSGDRLEDIAKVLDET